MDYKSPLRIAMEKAMNGEHAFTRENPEPWETKHYFMKWPDDPFSTASDAQIIDVPDDVDPEEFRLNGYQVPSAQPVVEEPQLTGSLFDTPVGYQSLLPEDEGEDLSTDPNCYMNFDGKTLDLYNKNGLVNGLDAQSGQDEYQSAKYQNVKNKGPLPEGTYYANQSERQNIDLKDAALGTLTGMLNINKGKWKGGPISWGLRRVWLKPDEKTNTYNRDGFSIHGGFSKGSAGCIDIPWQTGDLSDYLDNCQESVPVHVKYPKKW